MDLKHAYKKVQDRYPNEIPSMLTTITGPSASNAIGYTAMNGGHGPEQCYVFLTEDRF